MKCSEWAMSAASVTGQEWWKTSDCGSTRIRTDERTLVAIPNGTVATINLENLSRRDKILFKTSLGLRPESKADHVRWVLSEIRKLLYSHPKIETQSVRVRLTDIAGTALSVEVFCYILTRDFNEFAAVREDLLLRIMDVIEDSGGGLALPSQTLYIARDSGVEKEKAETAVKKISELRDGNKLPFPDFHKEDISSFKGSIQYPPAESDAEKPGRRRKKAVEVAERSARHRGASLRRTAEAAVSTCSLQRVRSAGHASALSAR